MGKLIRLDDALKEVEGSIGDWERGEITYMLEMLPTVEAIPVEWIKKRIKNWAEYGTQYLTIVEMLEDWKKENEIDRC